MTTALDPLASFRCSSRVVDADAEDVHARPGRGGHPPTGRARRHPVVPA
jgi:hypothetical protein